MANSYCVQPEVDDQDCDCLLDLLDGEGVITKKGICFSHDIYFNGKCMDCGEPRLDCPVYAKE